jgi:dinuclear metal center YbgI/SA1388 family protein
MPTVSAIADFLERFAPSYLAEDWDNVGLLVGDQSREATRVMTCLTITPDTAAEAISRGANLVVAHHPLPFRALKRLTTENTTGRMLLGLIEAKIAIYSPHTAFDSAANGINQRLARGLGLRGVLPLIVDAKGLGSGRIGWLEEPLGLAQMADRVKRFLSVEQLQIVGDADCPIRTMAVACGAAGEFLDAARKAHCDAMLIGETRYHTCLDAQAAGIGLILPGHHASERFAVECLADLLGKEFPSLEVWASRDERDPLVWV